MKSVAERRGDALSQLKELGRCNVPNAAVLMGIHHHTLRSYIEDGSVEPYWIGKRPWVMKDEIERFQREGKRHSNYSATDPSIGKLYKPNPHD